MINNLWELYLGLWIFTFPATFYVVYTIVTETLDVIFNSKKIERMEKYLENINPKNYNATFEKQKIQQSYIDKSLLVEMSRQIDYKTLFEKSNKKHVAERKMIIRAKKMSDIFKLK